MVDLAGLPYAVEPMVLADVPTVAVLEQLVFTMPWPEGAFRSELHVGSTACFLVARYLPWVGSPAVGMTLGGHAHGRALDSSILGYGGYWPVVEEAHICTLGVRAEWRRRGVGRLLLVALLELAIAQGAEVATLEVRVSNLAAQQLYDSLGFVPVGRRKSYYADNGEDGLIMTTPSLRTAGYAELLSRQAQAVRQALLAHSQPPTPSQGREHGTTPSAHHQ